jgi:hypothetical protein
MNGDGFSAVKLEADCASHILHSWVDGLQLLHLLCDRIGVFQAVPGDSANYATRLRNFLK